MFRYHAHVYFALNQEAVAKDLFEKIQKELECPHRLGRLEISLRGPHLLPQFEIDVRETEIDFLISWLRINRQGLSVLIHPDHKDELSAHTKEALWMGIVLPLDYSKLDLRLNGLSFRPYGERPSELDGAF